MGSTLTTRKSDLSGMVVGARLASAGSSEAAISQNGAKNKKHQASSNAGDLAGERSHDRAKENLTGSLQ